MDEKIVTIEKGGITYAVFYHSISAEGGARFLTDPKEEFQAGVMERAKGYVVQPHAHPRGERGVQGFSEFLYIEKGSIRVTVYDEEWNILGVHVLGPSDFLLFHRGGHSVEVIEDCRMVEVKQGPYLGNATRKNFQPPL